jgi:hypothetical protein
VSELEIPEAATDAAYDILLDWQPQFETTADVLSRVLDVAAPLIVAAELRRIADEIGGTDYGRVAAQVLHNRADELDPS